MSISFNHYCRQRFGCKVYKLSLDGGFTCPNRDGSLDTRGCIFCSAQGGGEFAQGPLDSPGEQLERARERVAAKNPSGKYMAYFQSFTGTYAPVERLERLYREAMAPEWILALAVGTRPDCLPPETVALLAELNREKPVFPELGLQTVHEKTAAYIRRGYGTGVYLDAMDRLQKAGLEPVTHIILGLPGETPEMAAETTRVAVEAGTRGVKFHLLHVLKDTDLERDYRAGGFPCLEPEEYAHTLELCLEQLAPDTVVHRITGDGAKKDLVAPLWTGNKKWALNYLRRRVKNLPEY